MALLTVTDAAKAFDISRTTVYEKIKSGELSRNSDKLIDTVDLVRLFGEPGAPKPEQSASVQSNEMATDLLDMVKKKDEQLALVRAELNDTQTRLNEHREAARALMSPEDFSKKESEWKAALAERQQQLELAKSEAKELEKSASDELSAWKKRSLFDRIFNNEPKLERS